MLSVSVVYSSLSSHSHSRASCRVTDMKKKENPEKCFHYSLESFQLTVFQKLCFWNFWQCLSLGVFIIIIGKFYRLGLMFRNKKNQKVRTESSKFFKTWLANVCD